MVSLVTSETSFGEKRILVVDDEERLAQSLEALLRGVGYRVRSATSGPEGLQALKDENYDLVITDIRMDGVDGFDIMHYLGESAPRTAVIAITGHASTESAIEALHQRVSDYILKPFDLETLCRVIERVLAKQEAERQRADFISMLTHDIKAPLTSIQGFAQLICGEDGAVSDKTPRFAQIIVSNCQKVLGLLDNYLTSARFEEGALELLEGQVNLREVLEQELYLNSFDLEKKEIQAELDLDGGPEWVWGDENLLSRAVSNLVGNAVKYTPRGGRFLVALEADDDEVRVRVTNTGGMLTDEECEHIFDRYRRAGTGKGIEGTGLGLYVVKFVAEAHGGRVRCDKSNNDEVTFTVFLPRRTG